MSHPITKNPYDGEMSVLIRQDGCEDLAHEIISDMK